MNSPLVSVIMNGHNASRYVSEAIESVLSQTHQNWEIIFWDNCSDDHTAEIVKEYQDPRIRYFRSENFTPLGHARNCAIEKSRGEYIAFLDCDDLWLPKKLECQMPLFADEKVGLVYSDTTWFNELGHERRLYGNRLPYQKSISLKAFQGSLLYSNANRLPCEGECFRKLLGRYFLSIDTVVLRRKSLEGESPYFDPRFNMIEEADLFRRIAFGWKIAGIPEPLSKWRAHGSSWTFKYPHLLREETEMMLIDFNHKIQGFDRLFSEDIKSLIEGISFSEAKDMWLKGNKWPLVKCLLKSKNIFNKFLTFFVIAWPASKAAWVLRLRGDILPASFFVG